METFKRAIRKVAAFGTGIAMLGATLSGALALDLADFPAPYVTAGTYDTSTLVVYGADATAEDSIGALDIGLGLQRAAQVCTPTGGTSVSVAGGVTEDVPIGINVAGSNQLDYELTDRDISILKDSTMSFQGTNYDYSELIELGQYYNTTLQTSLSSSDDDYETDIRLETVKKALNYVISFDDAIEVNASTSSQPLEIEFLGKKLKITNVVSDTKFTAYVGTEYYLDVGDKITVEGKTVTLDNVGSSSVSVDVDGVKEAIDESTTETVNGIEITVDDIFYTTEKGERASTLIIGEDSQETYTDGDAYVGEDKNNPDWKWNIGGLKTTPKASTTVNNTPNANSAGLGFTGPYIAVENSFRRDDYDDNPAKVGECYDFPNNYVSVCLDSLTVTDDNYMDISIELDKSIDFSDAYAARAASEAGIGIIAGESEGLKIPASYYQAWNVYNTSGLGKDIKTSEVYLDSEAVAGAPAASIVSVYYKDTTTNKIYWLGNISVNESFSTEGKLLEINYDDTKDSNIVFYLSNGTGTAGTNLTLTLNVTGDVSGDISTSSDDLSVYLGQSASAPYSFDAIGDSEATQESAELRWGVSTSGIGVKDEDHRTKYGIIVYDPKSNGGSSDKVKLKIPGDQVQGNIVVKGATTTTTTSAGMSCTAADITVDSRKDTQVSTPANYNLILVGGPAVNTLSAQFMGLDYPTYGGSGLLPFGEGEAIVKLYENGNNVALLVAGWSGSDSQRAARVLKEYADYTDKLTGTEVLVKGTSMTDITVEAA